MFITEHQATYYFEIKQIPPLDMYFLLNGVKAVNKHQLWDWFCVYNPAMFDNHNNIGIMAEELYGDSHTVESFGYLMRTIQTMAKEIINKYTCDDLVNQLNDVQIK